MNDILPTEYRPTEIDHFFGPARTIAKSIVKAAAMCKPRGVPASFLFYGPPGTGKSALASFTVQCFDVPKWNLVSKPGSDLTVEAMRDIAYDLQKTSMFPGYRGYKFDECDMSKKEGQGRFLTIADDLPKNVVIVATCNSHIEELEERFQRRFQVFEVKGPTIEEAIPLVNLWVGNDAAQRICTIAAQDSENARLVRPINVGAMLKDVTTYLQRA